MLADPDVVEDVEHKRLCALYAYQILDTPADGTFDNLLKLTSKCLSIPIAFISLIDRERQWVFASYGAGERNIPADISLYAPGLEDTSVFEVCDNLDLAGNYFTGHPMLSAEPPIRYYAGVPLIDGDQYRLGTLYVLDYEPRHMAETGIEMLQALAHEVIVHLMLRKTTRELEESLMRNTGQEKAEEELQVLSLVASKTNTGVNIMDKEGVTTWVNHSLEKLTGYTLEELKGTEIGNILSPNFYDQELIHKSRSMSKNSQSYAIEVLAEKKDGSSIWLEVSNTPIVNSNGNLERQIDLITDITQRKQVEQEMINAREQALKLSMAKEMFLSVMSHEIRTPLNAVIGMTHLLLDNEPKPSQIDDLNILKFSGENLLHIINDVLDFTKLDIGKMELENVSFSLKTLANDIVNSLQVNVKKNNNELTLLFDRQIPELISGDKNRLYQILMNLLGNAIKFTDKGLVQLKINLVSENWEKAVVNFVIEDNGIGIPKDKQHYIFETFTQAKTDVSRKYGGSGLGLAITKQLLGMHNADITVDSVEGEGTTFSFEITFMKAAEAAGGQILGPEIPAFTGKRVLVVDDNDINVLISTRMLSKWGLSIDSASDGYEAIEKVKTNSYDLVFMDIKMGGMNGFEATAVIRGLEGEYYQNIPIIALTASTLKNDHFKFKACGMNGHILKPFNPEQMKTLLFNIFSEKSS